MAEVAWAIAYLSTNTNMPQAWTKLPTKRCTFRIESFRLFQIFSIQNVTAVAWAKLPSKRCTFRIGVIQIFAPFKMWRRWHGHLLIYQPPLTCHKLGQNYQQNGAHSE